jgi:hypothetical protein
MGVTLVTYVTFVSNIIVMCHWSPNVSLETSYNWLSMMSGGGGRGRGRGGQKVLSRPSADSFAVGRRQKTYYPLNQWFWHETCMLNPKKLVPTFSWRGLFYIDVFMPKTGIFGLNEMSRHNRWYNAKCSWHRPTLKLNVAQLKTFFKKLQKIIVIFVIIDPLVPPRGQIHKKNTVFFTS